MCRNLRLNYVRYQLRRYTDDFSYGLYSTSVRFECRRAGSNSGFSVFLDLNLSYVFAHLESKVRDDRDICELD